MKRFALLFSVALMLLCVACGNADKKAIREAAYGYLDAMGNYRIADAEAFASEETCRVTLRYFEEVIMPHVDSSYIRSNMPAKITLGEITMINDSSAVVAFHKSTPITQQDSEVELIKENGAWKVNAVIIIPGMLQMRDSARVIPNVHELREGNPDSLHVVQ